MTYWTSRGIVRKTGKATIIIDDIWPYWGLYGHWIFKYDDIDIRDIVWWGVN